MSTIKVLSIDWDYFIEATLEQRVSMFPDGGNENIPDFLKSLVWTSHYINGQLEQIGVKENDIKTIKKIIKNNYFDNIMIADSHKHIYDFINEYCEEQASFFDDIDKINLVNVDFHHDMYEGVEKEVHCGNWCNALMDNFDVEYTWISQNDSDYDEKVKNKCNITNIKNIEKENYDLLYICKSTVWSPPHLDKHFKDAFSFILDNKTTPIQYQTNIFDDRYSEDFKTLIENEKAIYSKYKTKTENSKSL